MAKILQKTKLAALLYSEGYDKIVFELSEDGTTATWYPVSTGFCCTCNPDGTRQYPDYTLRRVDFYDVTHREVRDKIAEIEADIGQGEYCPQL